MKRSDSYYERFLEPLEEADFYGEQAYLRGLETESEPKGNRDERDAAAENFDPMERGTALDPREFSDGWTT